MAARSYRLEIWDRTRTARRAIIGAVLAAERRQVLQGEETVAVDVPADDPATAELTSGAVLRLQRLGSATDATLWRLASRQDARAADRGLSLRLTADALWLDFRHGMVRQVQVGGRPLFTFGLIGLTPTQWLQDFILPGYDGGAIAFQLGTVEPTDPVDLAFDRTSPLAALRALEAAVPGGAEAQFRLSPDGSFYYVDLLARVGRTQGGAELRYAKNVRGLVRLEDEADVETRLYAAGAGLLTLADAEWTISAVAGAAGARVLSFDGPDPVFEDGAHVGLWFHIDAKGAYPITAADAGSGTLTVDDTALPALAAGDVGRIATDAAGTPLAYIESPAGRAAYDVRVGDLVALDIPDARNLVPNGDLTDETAGLPTGWGLEGAPVVTRSTDPVYARQGGVAWRVQAAADGDGLVSDPFTLDLPTDRPYTALLAGLTIVAGKVRVELRHENGTTYPIAERPASEGVGIYLELKAGPVHDEPLPAGTAQVAIVAHGGAAEFYADAAMVSPAVGADVPSFIAGSGAHALWQRAAAELADRRLPKVEYRVDVLDLFRADPDRFRFDELLLGDDVKLRDPDVGRETVRIVELVQDLVRAEVTRVALASSARRRITDPFRPPAPPIGGRRPGSGSGALQQARAAVLSHTPQFDPADGLLYVPVLGNPRTATLELYTKTSPGEAYPGVPVDTIDGRQGTFAGQAVEDALLYRIVPRDGRGVAGDAVEGAFDRRQLRCRARVIASDADTVTVQVDADAPDGTATQVYLLGLVGATRAAGAGLGVPVPSGSQWTFIRPVFQAGDGVADFRAEAPGYRVDDASVLIPEAGRDTVALTLRARVISKTSTTVTVRVSVGDPQYAEGAGDISIAYAASGTGGVAPASPQTIAAAVVRDTPAATEAQGGFVDFTITRPAAGSGTGRVTFTATRAGRVEDHDAVDVPELPPDVPVQALPPTCAIEVTAIDAANTATVQVTGTAGQGGPAPTDYRRRWWKHGTAPTAWSSWLALTNGEATFNAGLDAAGSWAIEAQVRTSGGVESEIARTSAIAELRGLDPATGLVDYEVPYGGGGGRTPSDTDSDAIAGRLADEDLTAFDAAGAIDRTNRRLLKLRDVAAGVDVSAADARYGKRMVDPNDPLKLPATETERADGATLEAVSQRLRPDGLAGSGFAYHDGSQAHPIVTEFLPGSVRDGQTKIFSDFGVTFQNPPRVTLIPNGAQEAMGLLNAYGRRTEALDVTAAGFKCYAKFEEFVGGTTDRTAFFSSGHVGGPPWQANNGFDQAYDDKYTYHYDITIPANSAARVEIWANGASGWSLVATRDHVNALPEPLNLVGMTYQITEDALYDPTAGVNEFGMDVETISGSAPTLSPDRVTFKTATAPNTEGMHDNAGAPDAIFFAVGT